MSIGSLRGRSIAEGSLFGNKDSEIARLNGIYAKLLDDAGEAFIARDQNFDIYEFIEG